ncbi:iron-siderophore ABC transporter substrate-binding protein [Corynebacterium callunae]|uniref:ABC transporter substrate-binding protein n=1 Tax=Corynebacterium callunae TaxID=1721 RepID=UPI003981E7D9
MNFRHLPQIKGIKQHSSLKKALVPACIGLVLALSACTGSTETTGSSETAGSTEVAAVAEYTVEHAMGTTVIDGPVERVVVIDSPHLDALLALGITPVGATESGAENGFPTYLADQLQDTESVGLTAEPNLEKIAALDPDLIIGAKVRHEGIYEQLSAIAPTVMSEGSGTNWHEQAEITAAAVNRSAEMTTLINDLSTRADEVGEEIGAEGQTVSMVRFRPDNFRLYGPETFSGSILEEVGYDLGEKQWNEYSMMELSTENFSQIDGDLIFYTIPGGDPAATTYPQVSALWGDSPAVQQNKTYEFEDETWMIGIGVLGGNEILDDLEEILS